jgi:integrase/recombinase XerD
VSTGEPSTRLGGADEHRQRGSGDGVTRDAERFLDHLAVERGLSDNTLLAYRKDLRRYASFLARRNIRRTVDVDESAIRSFVASISASTYGDERPYAPTSVGRALSAVRSFHRFLLREGVTTRDPAAAVVRPKLPRALPHPLTVGEVQAVLEMPTADSPGGIRDRAWLELLYASGLRVSELTALDIDDVDLEGNAVRVLGKGGKEREVPIGRHANEAVGAYLARSRPALVSARSRGALFLNARGGRLTRQSVGRLLEEYARRAGIRRRVTPHDLRHSFATHLLDGGADVRVVQELLGHASVATTQIYTLVTKEHLRAVYYTAHPRARRGAVRKER